MFFLAKMIFLQYNKVLKLRIMRNFLMALLLVILLVVGNAIWKKYKDNIKGFFSFVAVIALMYFLGAIFGKFDNIVCGVLSWVFYIFTILIFASFCINNGLKWLLYAALVLAAFFVGFCWLA